MAQIPGFGSLVLNYLDYWRFPQPEAVRKLLGGELMDRDITNTCTVRLSHAMNLAGHKIPRKWGPVTNRRSKAGDYYIIRVKDFRSWMQATFDKPLIDVTKKPGDAFDRAVINGYQGIIGFEIAFQDATGHFDLWYRDTFSHEKSAGKDYFGTANRIQLWSDGTRVTQAPV